VEELKEVDMVTCTTEHFAKWLRIHNKNVHVLPNCLDPEKWQKDSKKSNLVRFGWIGGVFHDNDLKLLTNSLMEMYRKEKGFQVVLGGWNQNKYYEDYERILSGSGIALSQEYRDWLKEKTFIHEHYYFNEPYRRIRGTAVDKYGDIYNEIDVALVPLAGNTFNTYKSEIKLVEAGMKGKAAIVSDTLPYNIFPKDTVMFVDSKDSKGWYKAMKKLMDKDLREELSVKLHEYVIKNYDLSEWNKVRTKIYKQWTQEN
jgi:glycosyltransferase involved in cell wall biosynthesis